MGKTVDNTIFEVSHPEVWSLALRLCADRLKFTIHSDSDDNSLMFGELPFAKCALMRRVSVAAGIGMPRLIYTLGCDSEKKIEQALFFPLILHYLFRK